jgi:Domain of unknown function (DUF4336)
MSASDRELELQAGSACPSQPDRQTYPPLNTLKQVADDVWIVDGPLIEFGPRLLRMPFPTRMSIIQIGRELFIHSPTPLTAGLKAEIAAIGTPAWIIGPNRIHYWWIPDWCEAYPDAVVYLAPRIVDQASGRLDQVSHRCRPLDGRSGYPWDGKIDTLPVHGGYMSEIVFFHRPSRTLVLTDMIENFEPQKLGLFARVLTWLGGAQHPDGKMPHDMRLTYRAKATELRAAVDMMIGWNPARIILAHGRWYERGGADELRRAFRWLLNS